MPDVRSLSADDGGRYFGQTVLREEADVYVVQCQAGSRQGGTVTFELTLPRTLHAARKLWGDETLLKYAVRGALIAAQAAKRPGRARPVKLESVASRLDRMSREDLAALLQALQSRLGG